MLRNYSLFVSSVVLGFLVLASFYIPDSSESQEIIRRLNTLKHTQVVIGTEYFRDEAVFENTNATINRLLDTADTKRRAYGYEPEISVGILSGGGRVDFYEKFSERYGERLRAAKVTCTISFAGSMAFTYMLEFCDEREFMGDTLIMQHRVYYSLFGYKFFNEATEELSKKFSSIEADRLGVDDMVWFYVSREQGDHYFDSSEIKEFNLATSIRR